MLSTVRGGSDAISDGSQQLGMPNGYIWVIDEHIHNRVFRAESELCWQVGSGGRMKAEKHKFDRTSGVIPLNTSIYVIDL